jgi:multiple sugar transport system permease protein
VSALTRHALLLLASAGMLLPFVELLVGALRTPAERVARPPVFWPGDPQWGAFARAFEELPLLAWGLNSVIVTFSITLIQLATCSAAGFALAKYDFRGRGLVFRLVLGAQMVPFFLLLIPLFFVMRYWPLAGGNGLVTFDGQGLLGSYAALMLPFTVSWFGIFMMRQYTMAVPDELLDAARVDGASELRLLTLVVLPLVRPGPADAGPVLLRLPLERVPLDGDRDPDRARAPDPPGRHPPPPERLPDAADEALRQAALVLSTLPLLVLFTVAQRFYTGCGADFGVEGVVGPLAIRLVLCVAFARQQRWSADERRDGKNLGGVGRSGEFRRGRRCGHHGDAPSPPTSRRPGGRRGVARLLRPDETEPEDVPLAHGYAIAEEDAFDRAMRDVREGPPIPFSAARRGPARLRARCRSSSTRTSSAPAQGEAAPGSHGLAQPNRSGAGLQHDRDDNGNPVGIERARSSAPGTAARGRVGWTA